MAHVLTKIEVTEAQNADEIAALARDLGLPVQERRYSAKHSIERDFRPLSADEAMVWRAFCPTAYRTGIAEGASTLICSAGWRYLWERVRPLQDYSHDTIPAEVLRHWVHIKNHYAFDAYEIRTTERTLVGPDPILIGFFGGDLYLLARWGLESPESMPFRDVARRVMQDAERECGTNKFLWYEDRHYLHSRPWQAAGRLLAA